MLAVGFGAFAAFRVYLWAKRWMLPYISIGGHPLNCGEALAVLVMVVGFVASYYVMFVNRRSVEFLIEVERELKEVAWPEYQPVFNPKAELWGSTYVVIGMVAVLGVFIFLVDTVYEGLMSLLFYR